jgi:hypothetical protein
MTKLKRFLRRATVLITTLMVIFAVVGQVRSQYAGDIIRVQSQYVDGTTFYQREFVFATGSGVMGVDLRYGRYPFDTTEEMRSSTVFKELDNGIRMKWTIQEPRGLPRLSGFDTWWGEMGFALVHDVRPMSTWWRMNAPFWVVALVGLVYPLLLFAGVTRSFLRRRAGRCTTCGYDIRATPKRCPECASQD